MRVFTCLAFLLAASAANAETYMTVVNRDSKTVTVTGPNTTAVTTQVSRTSNGATYSTTVTRNNGGYQPMGASGYHPMGH